MSRLPVAQKSPTIALTADRAAALVQADGPDSRSDAAVRGASTSRRALDRYLATRPELQTVVVRGQGGGRGSVPLLATRIGRPITPLEVFRLRRLAQEASLPAEVIAALTSHVGRRTTAELAWPAGHDVHEIMELLGHASITTTQRYLHGSGAAVGECPRCWRRAFVQRRCRRRRDAGCIRVGRYRVTSVLGPHLPISGSFLVVQARNSNVVHCPMA